jgi:hypothetical protein
LTPFFTFPPTPAPTTPFQVVDDLSDNDDESSLADMAPAIVMGVASSIIVCALALYAVDLRERYQSPPPGGMMTGDDVSHKPDEQTSMGRDEDDTSVGSVSHSSQSGYWINTKQLVKYEGPILPPMLALTKYDAAEDQSISRISTMTQSVAYSYGLEDMASRLAIESSSQVTELSDDYRVGKDTALTTLVKSGENISSSSSSDMSRSSSLTSVNSNASSLVGESFAEEGEGAKGYKRVGSPPFEYTPDKTDEGRDAMSESGWEDEERAEAEAELEQMVARLSFDGKQEVVREIYFAPSATAKDGHVSMGLRLVDAVSSMSCPSVAAVDLSSPLIGRIFIGDVIMSIDDADTSGLSADEALALMELVDGRQMVKLTVCSHEYDGGSDTDGQDSLDFGVPETSEEV